MHNIPITIADITIELSSPLSSVDLGIEPRLGAYIGKTANPLARLAVRWEESEMPPDPNGEMIYSPRSIANATCKIYFDNLNYYAEFSLGEEGQQMRRAVLRANPDWDEFLVTEQRTGDAWRSLLGLGAGNLIFSAANFITGGMIFHASVLEDNGKGVAFVGHSGDGKSTQLVMWADEPGVIVMNDDRVAVRVTESGPMCYGIPWGGTADIARNHAAPLAAIFILEKAPETRIESLVPAQAAALLAVRSYLPYWESTLMRRAMANLNTILECVPVYYLRCRPEKATIPLVRSVL